MQSTWINKLAKYNQNVPSVDAKDEKTKNMFSKIIKQIMLTNNLFSKNSF